MKPPYFILILLFPLGLWSQNPIIDSLKQELAKARKDTSIIKISIDLAHQLREIHPDSAHLLCWEAGRRIPAITDPKIKIRALRKVGIGYHGIRQLDTAILFLVRAKILAEEMSDQESLADLYNNLGTVYRTKKNTSKALHYYQKSLEAKRALEDKSGQTVAHNNIGVIYMETRKYVEAINHYEQALELQEDLGNKAFQSGILWNLGLCYRAQDEFKKAIDHFQRAVKIKKELDNPTQLAVILLELGTTFKNYGYIPQALNFSQQALNAWRELGNVKREGDVLKRISSIYRTVEEYDKSLEYLYEVLKIREDLNDKRRQASTLNDIGHTLMLKGEYETALSFLHRSIKIYTENDLDHRTHYPIFNIGSTYQKLNRLDSAEIYLQEAFHLAKERKSVYIQILSLTDLGRLALKQGRERQAIHHLKAADGLKSKWYLKYKEEKAIISKLLYEIYKKQNNYKASLHYYETYQSLQDSLFNIENTKKLTRLEAEYEFEKEKEQLASEKEKISTQLRTQSTYQIATVLALLIALIFIFIITRYYRLKRKANVRLTDLNTQLSAQNQLVEQQKQRLQELDQAKTRLYTNITHEFRTPLTVILGMAEQLKSRESFNAAEKKQLTLIRRNGKNLLKLINQILDLSKIENNDLKANYIQGDVIKYIRYITESFHSLANTQNILLRIEAKPDGNQGDILMDYDPEKLRQILSNLLSNAIKYTPSGGRVTVGITVDGHQPTIIDGLKMSSLHLPSENSLLITVTDTGSGISPEDLPNIFNRFYQTGDNLTNAGGTGIGLALTQELVKLLKGTIDVESEPGKGTTFRVHLPITRIAILEKPDEGLTVHDRQSMELIHPASSIQQLESSTQHPESSIQHPVSSTPYPASSIQHPASSIQHPISSTPHPIINNPEHLGSTILIIEDNVDVVEYLNACLKDQYQLDFAYNGKSGIDIALKTIPDIIISDVMMPEKDGFEVCDVLKNDERSNHIPIILLTAKADVESRISGLQRGADAYLKKPFHLKELFAIIQNLLILRKKLQIHYRSLETPLLNISSTHDHAVQDAFIQKVKKNIVDQLDNPDFGIPYLCRAIGLSRSQLHKKIKALTGLSTSLYMRNIRLQKAKHLLETSKMNVSEVAYEVGFKDPKYFSRLFIEAFGIKPTKVRK